MPDVIRYGVLGASRIGRNKHVPAAAESEIAEITAVASRAEATARAWAEQTGVAKAYGSYEQLLADDAVDAVINTLPNSMHAEWTLKALAAGKHVLCEKPLGMNAGEVDVMFDAAEAAGLTLMEGFITRFHPQLDLIDEVIASGAIGELRLMTAELVYPIGDWGGDSRTVAELGGGALMDAGCYCVNIIRHVMGDEPTRVQGSQREHPTCKVDSAFAGILSFSDGRLACLTTGMEEPFRVWCEITGTRGRIHVSSLFAGSTVTITAGGGDPRVETLVPDNLFRRQLDHFARCVRGELRPRLSRAESRGNAAALAGLKRSAVEGRAVHPD